MSFASAIRRVPLAFDPAAGAEVAQLYASESPEVKSVVAGAAGSSYYLRALLARERDWFAAALAEDPAEIVPQIIAACAEVPDANVAEELRRLKRRLSLYVGMADLAGVWDLERVTGALTAFADASTDRALKAALAPFLRGGKVPGQGEDTLNDAAGMCVLAMGKMGAFELNYSSDIDLIVLFDGSRFEGAEVAEARGVFVKVTRRMTSLLQEQTGEGYVWRTDLRLRPDPSVMPVCIAMDTAERYYESLGRTWERAAHIKARPAAGDLKAAERYLQRLEPFVWRRHLDFAAIEDAHDMRLRIRSHKGLYNEDTLEGRNLKLGQGGIRAIEFFAQTQQLIAGGRDPGLRLRGTVAALDALTDRNWIPQEVGDALIVHYRALREVEHRLQMISDARTHSLPTTPEGFDRVARLSGAPDTAAWRAEVARCLADVHGQTEAFFTRTDSLSKRDEPVLKEPEIVGRWRHYPALRSSRAQAIFERLKPELLGRLGAAKQPDEAIAAFDGFLAGLPAGVQVFSMFEANPKLRALMTDIAATAPALAHYLSRNASVLEAVVSGSFFEPWPGIEALKNALIAVIARETDYERKLDAARQWMKEWHFRIGVHHLRGLTHAEDAGLQYANLAEATLAALTPAVVAHFAEKHGPPPGNGLAVLGMGSLGAGWLTAGSDLDLIVIYDPADQSDSEGRRPLATRPYYARLTQALVTALSAPTAEGKLYEVDMRLRPSGRQGPVATSLRAFDSYQRGEAWLWEHMALTRARCVAGVASVCAGADAVRVAVLDQDYVASDVWTEVRKMRQRLSQAKTPDGPLDVKPGPGGLQDIELVAQAAALLSRSSSRTTRAQLDDAAQSGTLPSKAASTLQSTHRLERTILSAGRLVLDGPLSAEALGEGACAILLRETGFSDMAALESRLNVVRSQAADLIDALIAEAPASLGRAT